MDFIKRLGKEITTSWDLGGVVVFKILEAWVASRYLKKKKPEVPNSSVQGPQPRRE